MELLVGTSHLNDLRPERRTPPRVIARLPAYHNFCRVHKTLRVSPAMESKLTDHIWSVEELLLAGKEVEKAV